MWIFVLVFGVAFGSAANALIDRLPDNKSWVKGRSMCDKCKHTLEWQDLIPVFSFITLKGKCRYCHSPIPPRNLMVEIFMGLGFVVIFNLGLPVLVSFVLALMLWITTVIAVMDWETKLVAEIMVAVWAVLVLIYQTLNMGFNLNFRQILQWTNFSDNLLGLILGVLIIGGIWAVTHGRAMGFGDVEIVAVMGWWLGWQAVLVGLWVAFVSGAAVGLVKIMNKEAKLKSEIAFGPFLILGAWAAFFFGERILMVWNL